MFQNPKIVLSPTYAYLQQEIRKIPAGDYRILETYCDRRNMVRKIELAGGRIFVLKQYKRPTRLNQFAYTLFRKSKACRAYEYALRLQQLGFETAAPVAVSFQDAIVARRDFSDLLLQVCVCRRQDDFRILKHTSKFGVKHRRSKAQNAVKLFKK
jgi:hypothetical protein